jgi:hypothetical protein
MKVIIAGSRSIYYINLVVRAIKESGFDITEVVCGEARGVDTLGKRWAKGNNIPVKSFPADWETYGKSAGYKRNVDMAEYAEALIAITIGSPGTKHMINISRNKGLLVFVLEI